MTAQLTRNREIVAVFKTRQEADQAKQAIQAAGLNGQKILIDDSIPADLQLAAQGITMGPEAGLLMGFTLGGIVGLIATIIIVFQLTGDYPSSAASRIAVFASAIAGGVFGVGAGRTLKARQPARQQMKGNPNLPREYKLIVEGSHDDVIKAQQALGQPPVTA
ncbi:MULTISPECIES: hypothetical protein [Cyanophyceae]|uniref:hypothetical protein n=1 Tax=Cyanophyceae TaxID=3028117 RepID=UPI00168643FF|nr:MULTISPECIES: hypothetical protein [Cyanophyceae]MBD1914690.1 hypothetical protein [Phormidium sp. FACHB-77]MBD2032578.1 hypothetical protein [Phormidium sp. FACHB-322]MBD2049436.1 hypothetical protein [Leptolyngbya sp. FACHB-60]